MNISFTQLKNNIPTYFILYIFFEKWFSSYFPVENIELIRSSRYLKPQKESNKNKRKFQYLVFKPQYLMCLTNRTLKVFNHDLSQIFFTIQSLRNKIMIRKIRNRHNLNNSFIKNYPNTT